MKHKVSFITRKVSLVGAPRLNERRRRYLQNLENQIGIKNNFVKSKTGFYFSQRLEEHEDYIVAIYIRKI